MKARHRKFHTGSLDLSLHCCGVPTMPPASGSQSIPQPFRFSQLMGLAATSAQHPRPLPRPPLSALPVSFCFWGVALLHQNSLSRTRIAAAKALKHLCLDWDATYEAGSVSVNLFPKLVSPFLDDSDKQYALVRGHDLPSDSAAMALQINKGSFVTLKPLERGCETLGRAIQDTRINIRDLQDRHHDPSARFIHLQAELEEFTMSKHFLGARNCMGRVQ